MIEMEQEYVAPPPTTPTDIGGSKVDRAFVSEATREMSRGQRANLPDLRLEQQQLSAEEQRLNDHDRTMQARLAELNAAVVGKRLDPKKYRDICGEQVTLKKRLAANANRRGAIQQQMVRLQGLFADLNASPDKSKSPGNVLQELILRELRSINAKLSKLVEQKV